MDMYKGRDIQYYDTIEEALSSVEGNDYPLILLHAGVYSGEWLYIDTPVCILGAGKWKSINSNLNSSSHPVQSKSRNELEIHILQLWKD